MFSASSGQRTVSVSPTQSSASSTILDQGTLNVSIEAVPSVDEGAAAAFTVYLSKAINEDVSVEWSTRQPGQVLTAVETAEPDIDYLASADTVVIPVGATAAMFTISTTDDTLAEGGETFQVELEEARRGTGVSPQRIPLGVTQAFTTIVDNDDVPDGITVSASPKRLTEDAGATDIAVTVTLDGVSQLTVDTPVTIEFINRPNVNINATFGEDYYSTRADAVIPAGQSSVTTTVTLTPVDDNVAEDDEVARLSARSTAFTDSVGLGIVIEDNDAEPVEIAITVTPETLDETAGITLLNVTASLVGQTARRVDTLVTVITDNGTATAGEDFETASITLTVPVGELSASGTLNLTLTDDTLHEGDETLEISGSAPGLMVTGAEVTIRDDDAAPTSIGLSVTPSPITEGGGAVGLPVEATLLGGGTRTEDTTVNVGLVDLTATATDDYTAIWNTPALTIPAGRFRATITLTLTPVQDTVYEGPETIAVRGENSDPGLPINGLRLTIVDDDPAPTTLGLSVNPDIISEAAVLESADVTATLDGTVTLQEDLFINVSLVKSGPTPITIGGILLTPLVIAAGELEGTSTLLFGGFDDEVDTEDQTVEFRGTSSNPDIKVLPDEVVVKDDDTAGVSISPNSLSITEGRRKNYTIKLDSEPTSDVTVTVDLPANADFTVNPGTITFTPQSWGPKYVYVRSNDDDDAADEPPTVITHTVVSSDTKYSGFAAGSVSVSIKDDDDPRVEVGFEHSTYDVAESDDVSTVDKRENEVTVKVTLSADPERAVDIPLILTNQGASDDDYSLSETSVTFNSGETEKSFTFTAADDAEDDDGESVKLTFGALPTGVSAGTVSETIVSINDDDVPAVEVSFEHSTYDVAESDDASTVDKLENEVTVKVTLSAEPERPVDITLIPANQGASDADYSLSATSVIFGPTETSKTFTFTAADDAEDDDGESVKLSFDSPLPAGVSAGSTDEAIVSITDDDEPGVSISKASLEIEEGDSDTYEVELDTEPAGDVTVTIGGTTDTDLSLDQDTLTFTDQNWNVPQTVTVTADHDSDAVDEAEATITHTVSATEDDYDGLDADGVTVTVTDDDEPGVSISKASLEIEEGDSDAYDVELDTEPAGDVTVTIGGTTDTDLSLDKDTLTFTDQNWNVPQTVTVTADHDDDAADEPEVTLTHTASSDDDTTYDDLRAGSIAVSVTDNDEPGVSISKPSLEIEEGDSDTYDVELDTEPAGDVTVTIGGTTDTGLSLDKDTLTFTDQNWSVPQRVTVTADHDSDAVDEAEATITHTVSATEDDYDGLDADGVTVTVTDDDEPGVSISKTSLEIEEGDSDTYEVALDTEPAGDVTVTIGGTTDTDLSLDKDTLTFTDQNWNVPQTVTVTADHDDDAADEPEVTLTHTASSDDDTTYDDLRAGSIAVSVTDNDEPGVSISKPSLEIEEGDSDTYDVELDTEPAGDVTVTIGGTTDTGLSLDKDTLTFTDQNWSVPQRVTVTADHDDDAVDEEQATLTHTASSPGDGDYDGLKAADVTVSINDDDVPSVTVSFGSATYPVDEGETETVTVTLSAAPEREVVVPIDTTDEGGASSDDYSLSETSVTFGPTETSKTFTFTAADDAEDDDGESVKLTFGSALPAGVSRGSVPETTVSITDDDAPSFLTVNFKKSGYTVTEGSIEEIVLTLDDDPERTVTIPLSWSNEDGASDSDHNGVPTDVTFNAGETEKSFEFSAVSDRIGDPGETVSIKLGAPPSGVTKGTTSETVVTIEDVAPLGVHDRQFRFGVLCAVRRLVHHRQSGDEPRSRE